MEVKWRNIIALVLVALAAVLALRFGPELLNALRASDAGRGAPDSPIYGLCVLGLLAVTVVVVVKLLVQRR